MSQFEFVRILNENSSSKLIVLEAKHIEAKEDETNSKAVVIFEKPHFSLDESKGLLTVNDHSLQFHNDVFRKFSLYPGKPLNTVQGTLIYPATDAQISKYTFQEQFIVDESYEDWVNLTEPYIKKSAFNYQWVYNILDHKKETERIVLEDTDPESGFVLLPDMKWDGKTVDIMYLVAITHARDIQSLRSLDGDKHLKMLQNLLEKCLTLIETKYNLTRDKIRAYVHYQPTYYHFHVHFNHVKNQQMTMRDHSLKNVIENLKVDKDYYKKVSLEFLVKKNEGLYESYKNRIESASQ